MAKLAVKSLPFVQNIQQKFADARKALTTALIERDDEIDLVLTALIARDHPLLVGNPGTAKTLLLTSIGKWMDAPVFSYLLTKFTDPGEIFGPVDVVALTKERKTQRAVDGYAPAASFVFFDEIFKASSAILNTTLTFLNERKFKCGLQEIDCPLLMCVAASNEWPADNDGGKELGALLDRFLLRKKVRPVSARGRMELVRRAMDSNNCEPHFKGTITAKELAIASDAAVQLAWSKDGADAFKTVLTELSKEGIMPGDRRVYKSVKAARAFAYLCGGEKVEPEHLEILAHVLWDDPTEQPEKAAKIVARIANPIGMKVNELLMQVEDVLVKSKPTEAVSKLQEISKQLETMKKDDRVTRAGVYVGQCIKDLFREVTGIHKFSNNEEPF